MCSLTFQALTSGQPVYIRNMFQPLRKVGLRTLRSSDLDQLNVPRVKTAVGSRAFSVAVPRLWNELSLEIRSAKNKLVFGKKWKLFFWSGFSDLNPRWSRGQTQTVSEIGVGLRLCLSRLWARITKDLGAIEVYYYYYYYYHYYILWGDLHSYNAEIFLYKHENQLICIFKMTAMG